jgi:DNA-directed RNA polymerase subunit F
MRPEIVEEKPITCFEAKSILETVEARDEELSFRAGKTKEYVNTITHLTAEQAVALQKELETLDIPRLKDVHVVKIIDIFPSNEEELKNLLSGYMLSLKGEHLQQILDVLAKHR